MASIKPHKNGWRAQVYVAGQRDSATRLTKREAEAWAAARETELRADAKKSPGEKHTLRDAFEKYRIEITPTKRGWRNETLRLQAFERDALLPVNLPIGQITSDLLGVWRGARLLQVGPGTVLREMGLLSAVFEEARREWKWVAVNPVRDVRRPRAPDHREVVISIPKIAAMLREMGYSPRGKVKTVAQAVAVCFLTALRTGMRAGELCGLRWHRMYPGYCKTPHKVGRLDTSLRDVPLQKKALRLIGKMVDYDPKLVFGISAPSLDANFRKYRNRAGLSGFTFHDSRHTAATWIAGRMKSEGLPAAQAVMDLCKIFGWTKMDQALVYFNPSASEIAARMQ